MYLFAFTRSRDAFSSYISPSSEKDMKELQLGVHLTPRGARSLLNLSATCPFLLAARPWAGPWELFSPLLEPTKVFLHQSFYIFLFLVLKILYIFSKGGREGEKRVRNSDVREKQGLAASYTHPKQGLNPQPKHVQ